jgi:hypothetical protein
MIKYKLLLIGLLTLSLFALPVRSQQAVSCQEVIGIADAIGVINEQELLYETGDKQNRKVDQAISMVEFILEVMETNPACEVSLEKQLEKSQDALQALSI